MKLRGAMFNPFSRSQFESAPSTEPAQSSEITPSAEVPAQEIIASPASPQPEELTPPLAVTRAESPAFTSAMSGNEVVSFPAPMAPPNEETTAQPNALHSEASAVMAEKQQNQQKAA